MTAPDFFLLANLGSEHTGLPFCIWVSAWDGSSRDDVRLWISRTPKAVPSEMVCVAIRLDVHVVSGGEMSASDLVLLKKWVELNRAVIEKYWVGDIAYTEHVIAALRPLSS